MKLNNKYIGWMISGIVQNLKDSIQFPGYYG